MIKKIKKLKSGFVILFAVTISAIILAIALGVSNIAFREIKFGTNARGSNDAFFAADVGAECALLYDRNPFPPFDHENAFPVTPIPSPPPPPPPSTMDCAETSFPTPDPSPDNFWTFTVSEFGSSGQSCAIVTVDKTITFSCGSFNCTTTVTSKGYNVGDLNCDSTDPNRIEREIEVTY
ncbi:hypothetical protein A3A03_02535 [Candidatus Nomurabacteria bacterium RIFCSPLOWO2_01_FULL_40_18]|uniref:Type 4 fimbrial biogenesis protein PilX N-terminal domain-containing protein n=1 Tax=Candidatus Nomurabacteria bacterium RIFCSPLOWO2_01_FULL_40_18 TaxID=1801773 RepID=A0A1F6XKA0_9BACT|nr:MAG: hypothetical protein A3A03_02535 [Candidatus Nomurabacteria bacterium RIFCSPLOWO2_01_FULL_40_18]